MSYYPSQAYGAAYPQQYSYNTNHYPAYQAQATATVAYSHLYQSSQAKPPSPPPGPQTAPELSAITSDLASCAVQRLLTSELRDAGFDSAEPQALRRLELEVIAFVEQLYERAHEYANLANRANPIAKDFILASEEFGLQPKDLRPVAKKSKEHKDVTPLALLPPVSRSPSPELLSSDDEGITTIIPPGLRTLPWTERHLPALPPKHTYLRTPISPPKKAAIPSLEKKLKNAGLVQESLKNLLLATEDSTGQEDAELLGATVNWESTTHPRKRWKLSA